MYRHDRKMHLFFMEKLLLTRIKSQDKTDFLDFYKKLWSNS